MSDDQKVSWRSRLRHPFRKPSEVLEEEREQRVAKAPPPTLVEWSGHLLSALLLCGLIGYVMWMALQDSAPVSFEYRARMEQLRESDGGWVLPVEMGNLGGEGVLNLQITAELRNDGGEVVDEAEISLPLLGPREWASLELAFDEDPRLHTLYFNLGSYGVSP